MEFKSRCLTSEIEILAKILRSPWKKVVTNVQIGQFMFSFMCGVATLGLHFYVYAKSCTLVQPRFQGQLVVPLPQLP